MVFKDERRDPLKKNLRLAWAGDPAGPWQAGPQSFPKSWVDGPSVAPRRLACLHRPLRQAATLRRLPHGGPEAV